MNASPVVVCGAPRSGTTYLVSLLNSHPLVHVTNEARLFDWVERAVGATRDPDVNVGAEGSAFAAHVKDGLPELVRSFYRGLAPEALVWGDKNPHYLEPGREGVLELALELFPQLRVVHLVRDGRDVVTSLVRHGWASFEEAHALWRGFVGRGRTVGWSLPPGRYLELRYEDLVRDDLAAAERLLGFLGLPPADEVTSFCARQREQREWVGEPQRDVARGALASAWRETFDRGQLLASVEELADLLVATGYETPDSLGRLTAELSRDEAPSAAEAPRKRDQLVLTLLVRDEADIIEENLLFHLSHGVDFVIATDNGSTDGTLEILERYEREGVLRLIREPADDYSQAKWVTRMARLAATEHGADWVINADADEFWWPKRGTLKSALRSLPPEIGVVAAPRLNFVPRPPDAEPFFDRLVLRETRSFADPSVDGPGHKVCHRAHPGIEVEQGNHAVSGPPLVQLDGQEPIVVLHFPMRSFEQLENKIRLGGAAYARNAELDEKVGWTWRRLYERHLDGTLADWYGEHVVDDARAAEEIAAGRLVVDRRLSRALSRFAHEPPEPAPPPAPTEVVFVHIPKTAGSAFRKLLQQVYPPHWETLFDDEPGAELARFVEKAGRPPRVLTGHLPSSILLPRAPEARSIVWLREPVARVISTYFYWKTLPDEPDPRHSKVRSGETSLLQFATENANAYTHWWFKGYELEDFDFVGLVEYADEDVADAAALFGWGDVALESVNRTTSSEYKSFQPTPELLARIRELNHLDVALYERALELRARRRAGLAAA